MNEEQFKKLTPGDKVFWEDPDDGICSKWITVKTIRFERDVASITGEDGSITECFPCEIFFQKPKYNHAYDVAFEVINEKENHSDVTPGMLREGLMERARRMSDEEILEACSHFDTHKEC